MAEMSLLCKFCKKRMNVKIITTWKFSKWKDTEVPMTDSEGEDIVDYFEKRRHEYKHWRIVFPEHQKGSLFKKTCEGSNLKKVIKKHTWIRTQRDIDEEQKQIAMTRVQMGK